MIEYEVINIVFDYLSSNLFLPRRTVRAKVIDVFIVNVLRFKSLKNRFISSNIKSLQQAQVHTRTSRNIFQYIDA